MCLNDLSIPLEKELLNYNIEENMLVNISLMFG